MTQMTQIHSFAAGQAAKKYLRHLRTTKQQ
jgi:hypothetical protein